MAAAAKPKPKSSLPLLLGAGALLLVVVVMTGGGDSSTASSSSAKKSKKSAKDQDLFTPADYSARFAVFNAPPNDVFKPLITKGIKITPLKEANGPTGGVPTNLTGGEANWYYTGHVQLNGDNEALLENTTSGESVYVKPGEGWRAAHVQSIDVSAIVLVGSDGNAVDVPLQQYGDTPGQRTPVVKDAPLAVPAGALTGAIGGGVGAPGGPTNGPQRITLSNGQTLDLAPATVDSSASANGGNPRRRGRRNRNNNDSGDLNNVP